MALHKATLIQGIEEYLYYLKPHLHSFLELYARSGINEEDVILWIIEEEIELIYGLFTLNHTHSNRPHTYVHQSLNASLHITLSRLTTCYIKAPRIYDDNNQIEIKIINNDLYITYYSHFNNISSF